MSKDHSSTPKSIVNQAGEPVNPPIMEEFHDEEIAISYNVAEPNWEAFDMCRGKVNSDPITINLVAGSSAGAGTTRIFAATKVKLVKVHLALDRGAGSRGFRVSLIFHVRQQFWNPTKIQGRGFNHLEGTPAKLAPNKGKDSNGKEVVLSTPQYLTTAGTDYVHTGDTMPPPLEFNCYEAVAFTSLLTGLTDIPIPG